MFRVTGNEYFVSCIYIFRYLILQYLHGEQKEMSKIVSVLQKASLDSMM